MNCFPGWFSQAWLFSLALEFLFATSLLMAQDSNRLEAYGLHELNSLHLRLITDLPIDEEIRLLPTVFDAAMPQWADYFQLGKANMDEASYRDWKATAMLIGDRSRFQQAGLLTPDVPDFRDGYQSTGRIFLMEQPSPYYRRHLLLHEGTHWIMWRLFGSAGPTWYMEGVAEVLGTHTWKEGKLRLGVMPTSNDDVPYWGRLKILKDQLTNGTAPSLEEILRRPGSPRSPVEYYAWNWATVRFLMAEPERGRAIQELVLTHLADKQPEQITKDLMQHFRDDWPAIRAAFQCYVSEVEYGFDHDLAIPKLSTTSHPMTKEPTRSMIEAKHGWQSTGLAVNAGDRIRIEAQGSCTLVDEEEPLIAEPSGITLDYVNGHPWGKLLACVIPMSREEPTHTGSVKIVPIGRERIWTSDQSGILLLKINDRPSELADNQGAYQVTIQQP